MRFIFMILGALGAIWWFRNREASALAERQEHLPSGVRLMPERKSDAEPTPPAVVSAAIAASAVPPTPAPEASIAAVKTKKPSVPAKPGTGKSDDLTVLNGIGKVFAQRLNDAGIHTFADLAKQSPDRLREITQAKDWQKVDPAEWIAQAKRRADYGE